MSTLIRIGEEDKRRLVKLREQLHRKGIESLRGLRDICPNCGRPMDGFRFEVEYLQCPSCGYREKGVRIGGVGTFALGAIVGLGVAALATYLMKKEK
jgi:uncharacterized protein (DUF983 family)